MYSMYIVRGTRSSPAKCFISFYRNIACHPRNVNATDIHYSIVLELTKQNEITSLHFFFNKFIDVHTKSYETA